MPRITRQEHHSPAIRIGDDSREVGGLESYTIDRVRVPGLPLATLEMEGVGPIENTLRQAYRNGGVIYVQVGVPGMSIPVRVMEISENFTADDFSRWRVRLQQVDDGVVDREEVMFAEPVVATIRTEPFTDEEIAAIRARMDAEAT